MRRVTVDEDLRHRLHGLDRPLEFCDSSGKVLARYVPVVDSSKCENTARTVSDDEAHHGNTASNNQP